MYLFGLTVVLVHKQIRPVENIEVSKMILALTGRQTFTDLFRTNHFLLHAFGSSGLLASASQPLRACLSVRGTRETVALSLTFSCSWVGSSGGGEGAWT